MKKLKKTDKVKQTISNTMIQKCSQNIIDAMAIEQVREETYEDWELLSGCPYPAGSEVKIEYLRLRQERFGRHLVTASAAGRYERGYRQINGADLPKSYEHITAGEMDKILWNPDDNKLTIQRDRSTSCKKSSPNIVKSPSWLIQD